MVHYSHELSMLLHLLQLKERQKEDHMYDNTEKFITSAYRRKLEEDKKWQESQKLKYVTCLQLHTFGFAAARVSDRLASSGFSIDQQMRLVFMAVFQAASAAASPVTALKAPYEFASTCVQPSPLFAC
jgi:hypothetical protein